MKTINILIGGLVLLFAGLWFAPDDALHLGETHDHKVVETKCFANGVKCVDFIVCNDEYRVRGHGRHTELTRKDSVTFGMVEYEPLRIRKRSDSQPKVKKPK